MEMMGKVSLIQISLAFLLAAAFGSCRRAAKLPTNDVQQFSARGIVRGFSPDRKTIEIEHEAIPDFMPSMTMPFLPKNEKEIVNLKTGDAISFQMIVTAKDFWIEQVKKIPREAVNLAEAKPAAPGRDQSAARLREGDTMPDFTLIDEEGKQITNASLRGQPFIFTFIFTRCPLPNFCPRMSHNFSELQKAIKENFTALKNVRLLSITLDPEFDTSRVLKDYGAQQQADFAIWKFATGDTKEIDSLTRAFSVYRQNEGGTISHGLATALVNGDGKILKIWRGNGWTPDEVLKELRRAAGEKS